MTKYVTFRLAQALIGVNILDIREIVSCTRSTKVQQAPEFVFGLMNLRGQILTILDIGVLLGQKKSQIHSNSHVFIFKHTNVGFIVDQIGDVVAIDKKQIEVTPANIKPGIQKYMDHIINLPEEILMILNAKKVLSFVQTKNETSGEYL